MECYLLLCGVLSDGVLDPIIDEYEDHIARRANKLLLEGKITTLYADDPFNRHLVSICRIPTRSNRRDVSEQIAHVF